MRVLVAASSRHGSTKEIAEVVGGVLRGRGLDVTVAAVEDAPRVEDHDAVVLGSAVYMGRWTEEARTFVARESAALAARPVWLFSSGPIGDPLFPTDETVDAAEVERATGARGHRTLAGRLDRRRLGFAEKAVVMALRVRDGDYRDWDAVRAFAADVADGLLEAERRAAPPRA